MVMRIIQSFWLAVYAAMGVLAAGCGDTDLRSGTVLEQDCAGGGGGEAELQVRGLSSGKKTITEWVEVSQGTCDECPPGARWKVETGCDGVRG